MVFLITILIGTAVYYCWWLVRYYPLVFRGRKGASTGKTAAAGAVVAVAAGERAESVAPAAVEEKKEVTGPDKKTVPVTVPAVVPKAVFLPEIAGALTNELSRLMERAQLEKMGKETVVEAVRGLLRAESYAKLRGTLWEGKINDTIVRQFERYGPDHPMLDEVKGWWTEERG